MATQKFDGDTTIENLTVTGTTTATGAQTVGGNLSVTGTTTSGGAFTVSAGGASITGDTTVTGDLTLTGDLTATAATAEFSTCTTNGTVYAGTDCSAARLVERQAATVVTADTDHTVTANDRIIEVSTTAGGSGNTLTFGDTGVLHQRVIVRMTARDTNNYTAGVLGGTLTFDNANETAMLYHLGAGVWVPFLPAGALAAGYA